MTGVAALPEPQFIDPEWAQPVVPEPARQGGSADPIGKFLDGVDWGDVGVFVLKAAAGAVIGSVLSKYVVEPNLP